MATLSVRPWSPAITDTTAKVTDATLGMIGGNTNLPQAGDLLVLGWVSDNITTGTPTLSSLTVTGGGGALGTPIASANSTDATSGSTSDIIIGYALVPVTTSFTAQPTIVANLSGATSSKCAVAYCVTGGAGTYSIARTVQAPTSGDAGFFGGLVATAGNVTFVCNGVETNTAAPAFTGSEGDAGSNTTGGGAASNTGIRLGYTTSTTTQVAASGINDGVWVLEIAGGASGPPPSTGSASGSMSMTGSAAGAKTTQGTATGSMTQTGTAAGVITTSGTVAGSVTMTGSAAGTAPVTLMQGSASGSMAQTGAAAGSSPNGGTAAGSMTQTGTAAGAKTTQGTASGTMAQTGAAAGSRTSSGTAAGSMTQTGTAAGVAPPNNGSASGTMTMTATAVGDRTSSGTATGQLTQTGAAAGSRTSSGTASGVIAQTGSAAGTFDPQGSVSGSMTITGFASGGLQQSGVASGTLTTSGAAAGARMSEGSATGSLATSGSVSGTKLTSGSAAGADMDITGSAAGTTAMSGSATGSMTVTGAALGGNVQAGAASGSMTTSGAASGLRMSQGAVDASVAFDGTAVGAKTSQGAASGSDINFTGGSASGERVAQGSASGSMLMTGAALGGNVQAGAAVGNDMGFTGAASGLRMSQGSVDGDLTMTGAGVGLRSPVGSVDGDLTITGTAAGSRTSSGSADGDIDFLDTAVAIGRSPFGGSAVGNDMNFSGNAIGPEATYPPVPIVVRPVIRPRGPTWRYLLQRLDGAGGGDFLDTELLLSGADITTTLSGAGSLKGEIAKGKIRPYANDGLPTLLPWSTAIWAEESGSIRGGGIITDVTPSDSTYQVACIGIAGYPNGMAYTGARYWVEADPLQIFRDVWAELQGYPRGNVGVTVSDLASSVRIGDQLEQVEFDTQSGPVSFEAGPYKLAWYMTGDIGKELDGLAERTPFDWRCKSRWSDDKESLVHFIELGYPKLGVRRADLRFVVGENIYVQPSSTNAGEEYADELIVVGAGDGREAKHGYAARPTDLRLRRPTMMVDRDLPSDAAANARAQQELALSMGDFDITSITVRDHTNAPLGSWDNGDEILVDYDALGRTQLWCRILSTTISPERPDVASLTVVRAEGSR